MPENKAIMKKYLIYAEKTIQKVLKISSKKTKRKKLILNKLKNTV